MTPKGGTWFFLLFMACAALPNPPDRMPGNKGDFKYIAKKLMMKCRDKEYPVPTMRLLQTVFNNSDLPVEDSEPEQAETFRSLFLYVQNLTTVGANKDSPRQLPIDVSEKMTNKMWNCRYLAATIERMRNSSEPSACYLRAFLAPLSWAAVTTRGENIDSKDYDTLLWTAKSVLQNIPSTRMNLPAKVPGQNMRKMMDMLQEVFDDMSGNEKTHVAQWTKEQITQIYFNCTTRQPSGSKSMRLDRCKPSLKWLNSEAFDMMGQYVFHLASEDVDSSPKEQLCDFFRSVWFGSTTRRFPAKINPSMSKKFLQRLKGCFSEEEIQEHGDKLGPLACYYHSDPDLTPELSRKLLPQLDNCDNPTNLKKCLVNSVMSNSSSELALQHLGSSVRFLSPKQLSNIPAPILNKVLKKLGLRIKWTRSQLYVLLKKQLGDKKCKEVSVKKLMESQSVVEGLPSCVLKHIKEEILSDTEALKNISKRMRKGKLKFILQGLLMKGHLSKLVPKLPGPLLGSISLNNLDKAIITSLDQVKDKPWSRSQAALLLKKMYARMQLSFRDRRLCSVLQGISSWMIDKLNDSAVQDMVQVLTENPQCSLRLSKRQAGYIAQRVWGSLEKKRTDYFKTITEQELDNIPTFLLLHLWSRKVMDLPDSVCPVLLDKMEEANLKSLPLRAPSRRALTQRALRCLANGKGLSGLTAMNVSRLGPFLCELQPLQLRKMAHDVLNSSLQAMASCQHIPQEHRAELIQLIYQNFGNPSNWTADTMELLGTLLLLDDDATSALPNKPWMKDVLYFLKSRLSHVSDALKKKLFELTTSNPSDAACAKGAANSTSNGSSNNTTNTNRNSHSINTQEPTEALIEELGVSNIYWTGAQLELMSKSTFLATVETLGAISGYSADQLTVLSKKAIEAFGPVSHMTEYVVMQLGCIAPGFSNSDLEKLPFSLDTLEEIAKCGWSASQMELVWMAVAKYNNLSARQLGAADMVALNCFICGLNSSEIRQLSIDAFKDAVGSLDFIQCPFKVMHQFTSLAVSAFGQPRTWDEAHVSDLDNIIAWVNTTELTSLDPSVLSFLSGPCIPLFPPSNFAALSPAQLEALEPDTATMVTPKQRMMLRDDQLAALEKAATGSYEQSQNSVDSGAPSLSMEGISSLMKPLLFLLMGFLLL